MDNLGFVALGYVLLLIMLGIRCAHRSIQLLRYVRKNHPELVEKYGISKSGFCDSLQFNRAVCDTTQTEDQKLIRLQNRAKNSLLHIVLAIIPSLAFVIILAVAAIFFS